MMLAYNGPFWPLFLHVLGAMTLFGGVLAAAVLAYAGQRKITFWILVFSLPDWVVMRGGAAWVQHDEHLGSYDPTWLKLGMNVADPGLIVLLLALGCAFWWRRDGSARAGRLTAGFSTAYLLLLALAWLAMSGKWGA